MVRISIAITAVPERKDMVYSLIKKLGRPVPVAWDNDHVGLWWNIQRAWKMVKGGATHHLILPDDALVCDDFIASAERAISYRPEDYVGFFANHKVCERAVESGHSWVNINGGVWGACQMLPVHEIPQFLGWCRNHVVEEYKHDDRRLMAYLSSRGIKQFQTIPSLVEHGQPYNSFLNPSATKLPVSRVARVYTGESALEVDWTKGFDNPHYYGYPNNGNLIEEKWLLEGRWQLKEKAQLRKRTKRLRGSI